MRPAAAARPASLLLRPVALSALLVLLVAAVFLPARSGQLLAWDDDINLVENVHLRGFTAENVRWMFTDIAYTRRFMPLAWLDWALDWRLFGLTATSAHLGNIVAHALNAALVFFLLRQLVAGTQRELAPRTATLAAAAGALLWALHPLRVEVVAWASGRIYLQTAFFLFAATIAYLRAKHAAGRARSTWLALAALGLTLSLLTYPLAITFVGVLLVIDWYVKCARLPASPADPTRREASSTLLELVPFIAVTAIILGLTLLARMRASGIWAPPPTLAEFGIFARAMQAFFVWAYYVWKPLVPTGLSPVYAWLTNFDPRGPIFVASAVGVIGVTALLVWRRRRWPGLFALWLCHLILLAPVLGIFERPHFPNDRYDYIPGVLPAIALAMWLARARRRVVYAVVAGAALAGAFFTVAQIRVWRTSESIFRHMIARLGGDPYRADILWRLGQLLVDQGRLGEAKNVFRDTVALRRAEPAVHAYAGLAEIAEREGRNEDAVQFFQQALALDPNFVNALLGVGLQLLSRGDAAAAVPYLQRATERFSQHAVPVFWLGAALLRDGKPAAAVPCFDRAVALNPTWPAAHFNRGVALERAGRSDDARAAYLTTLRLAPNAVEAREALARVGGGSDKP